jgi:hydroxymethylbilane synthase
MEGPLLTLKAGIISLDGKELIKIKRSAAPEEGKELGKSIANEVLSKGGDRILQDIRRKIHP